MSPPEHAVDRERTRTEPVDVRSRPPDEIDVGPPNSMFGGVLAPATRAAVFDKHDARIARPNSIVAHGLTATTQASSPQPDPEIALQQDRNRPA